MTQAADMHQPELFIGAVGSGVLHLSSDNPDLDTRFGMVRAAGVFDYFDRTPPPAEVDLYRAASQRHGLALRAGGFYYRLNRDEPLLDWHLRIGADLGVRAHNVQVLTEDAQGVPVADEQVAQFYLRAAELGDRLGVWPCLEVHINMWSEHFGRVERVGRMVEAQGVPFRMTLDASHVIFKIDHPVEQQVQQMNCDIESGELVIDPRLPNHVCGKWIEAGWVALAHARPAVPNNPRNVWASGPDGQPGRGAQYPFLEPAPGQWHSPWSADRLEPWKAVMRQLLEHHAKSRIDSPLLISTEIIPFLDYGAGAGYSLFDDNVAVARWLREEWDKARVEPDPHTPVERESIDDAAGQRLAGPAGSDR